MTATITCAGCQHAYVETALFCPNCGRPKVREALADPLLGKLLGERFVVQALLGQGGSGTIYRAEHVTLRRKVAIKVLHTELSRDDLAVERFRREATTVAEIDNEHIVEIHDFGRAPDGRLYLAMELLEGETLDAVLVRDKQLSIERAADILIQVGEALMEAHAIGYVHRDLRPRNIYLSVRRGKANFIKLLDFGLAKLVETEGQAASTSLGMTFGDPKYMSPEQARGDRIDRRADIYQLGCVAYEMLTGAPPFSGNRVFDILTKQVTEAPQPLPTRRRGVPLWMEAAVTKMLAKDPDNRFATTTRMVEALRRGLETGEVMEDEVARRRESIPPPSVSRVMQRMGIQPGEPVRAPGEPVPSAPVPSAPVPSAPIVAAPPVPSAPIVAAPSPLPSPLVPAAPVVAVPLASPLPSPLVPAAPVIAVPLPSPLPSPLVPAAPVVAMPLPAASVAAAPVAAPVAPRPPILPAAPVLPAGGDPSVTMRAPVAPPPEKPDSIELLRKRTGTPRVGVPIHGGSPADQLPVAGVIEQAPAADAHPARESGRVESSSSSSSSPSPAFAHAGELPAHGRRNTPASSDLNFSQVWYDEGEQLLDDDEPAARRKRPNKKSLATTDLSLDDELPKPRHWGLLAGIGAFVVIGGTMAFALTRGPSRESAASLASREQPSATAPIDAAPSVILPPDPPATEPATTPPAAETAAPPSTAPTVATTGQTGTAGRSPAPAVATAGQTGTAGRSPATAAHPTAAPASANHLTALATAAPASHPTSPARPGAGGRVTARTPDSGGFPVIG
ncbi:MAG TPA: protein kinase, partial [Kofleriaceae bacterium]|nr:protein kinase [Kofleriaceae bacterium]